MSKLRKLSIILLIALLLNLSIIPSFAITTLGVSLIQQEQSNWCWAASALMVGKYAYPSTTVTQSQIVYHVKGTVDNLPADLYESADAAMFVTNYNTGYTVHSSYFSFSTTKNYIDSGVPIMARVYRSTPAQDSLGHFYVIYGYHESSTGQYLYIINPGDGYGYYVSYSDFLNGEWSENRLWVQSIAES